MKKLFLILVAMGCIMANSDIAKADFEDHPNDNQLKAFANSIIGTIKGLEQAYYVTNEKYFQGVWLLGSMATPDGTTSEDALYMGHPGSQPDTWQDFGPAIFKPGLKVPVNVRVDITQAQAGWGYVIVLSLYYEGIGPDNYDNDGDNWVYYHVEGEVNNPYLILDEWYINSDL
ncbi:MAG: hypothetical protein PVG39_02015 [Desulfobacteraceae bacterium]|jgi:hypothetical protein